MRLDYAKFVQKDTEVLVIGPEGRLEFQDYWEDHDLPFTGLPDPKHSVLKRYGQEVSLFKLGRMPAQAIVDKQGRLRFIHYGKSMRDIPSNTELLEILEGLNREEAVGSKHSQHSG